MAKTIGEQWREYAQRPPVARWVSRGSLAFGVAFAAALAVAAVALAVRGVMALL